MYVVQQVISAFSLSLHPLYSHIDCTPTDPQVLVVCVSSCHLRPSLFCHHTNHVSLLCVVQKERPRQVHSMWSRQADTSLSRPLFGNLHWDDSANSIRVLVLFSVHFREYDAGLCLLYMPDCETTRWRSGYSHPNLSITYAAHAHIPRSYWCSL